MAKLSIQMLLNLNGGSHNTADGVVAVFAPSFSCTIGNEDSYKFTNLDENLAINSGGTLLSIEGRPSITGNDTLHLVMWQFRQNTYFLQLDGSSFAPNVSAVIKDKYLNQETAVNLAGSTAIPFAITSDSASFARNRFVIFFKQNHLPEFFAALSAERKDKGVFLKWGIKTVSDNVVYEIEKSGTGRLFERAATMQPGNVNGSEKSFTWVDPNASGGNNFYRIKMIDKSGSFKYSDAVKVNAENEKSGITVFPNPVKGSTIGLQLNNVAKGDYTVTIFNNQGQKMYTSNLKHNGGSANLPVRVDKELKSGLYTLQVSNHGMVINKTLVVQ